MAILVSVTDSSFKPKPMKIIRFLAVKTTALSFIMSGFVVLLCDRSLAQNRINPDNSLGKENSRVLRTSDTQIDLILGGARRGSALFHSFKDFNIELGGEVSFSNPKGVRSILTRVTGPLRSEILGTLGVEGNADLVLLNPNGVYFGPQSRVDIAGSLFVSSDSALDLGDGTLFQADTSPVPSLLTMSVPIGVQLGSGTSGEIITEGELRTGKDLTLSGDRIMLEGELMSGRDLVLRSLNPIQSKARFQVGRNFKVEGAAKDFGQLVSPDGQVILTGGNVVLGDYEGGSLHILAGGQANLGDIQIVENGTVSATINPENQDKVNGKLTYADLTSVEISDFELQKDNTGRLKQVPIRRAIKIDGSDQATLDVRTGVDWNKLGGVFSQSKVSGDVSLTDNSYQTSSIAVDRVRIDKPKGQVLLTNRFRLNQVLENGVIVVKAIDTSVEGIEQDAGNVFILGSNNIVNSDIDVSSIFAPNEFLLPLNENNVSGDAGAIIISSISGNIKNTRINADSIGNLGRGGVVSISSNSGDINNDGISAGSRSFDGDSGKGGRISVSSNSGDINNDRFFVESRSSDGNSGWGGRISISSNSGDINNDRLSANSLSFDGDSGRGGAVSISSNSGDINNDRFFVESRSSDGNSGWGGRISISSNSGDINNDRLSANSLSRNGNSGRGGAVSISSNSGDIRNNFSVSADSQALRDGDSGRGGVVSISSNSGDINNDRISAGSRSFDGDSGRGGAVSISSNSGDINNDLFFVESRSSDGNSGWGGRISISSNSGDINNDRLSANSRSFDGDSGRGGAVSISSNSGDIRNNFSVSADSRALRDGDSGRGGVVSISSNSGDIRNSFSVSARSLSRNSASGWGGRISVSSNSGDINNERLSGDSFSFDGNSGRGGVVSVSSNSGDINNDRLSANSLSRNGNSGRGGVVLVSSNSGNINNDTLSTVSLSFGEGNSRYGGAVSVSSRLGNIYSGTIETFSYSENGQAGNSGSVTVTADRGFIRSINPTISITRGILTFSIGEQGSGDGGNIFLKSRTIRNLEIQTQSSSGISGDVKLRSPSKSLLIQNVNVIASARAKISNPFNPDKPPITIDATQIKSSGNVTISSPVSAQLERVTIESDSNGNNAAGKIKIQIKKHLTLKSSEITTNANEGGIAGNLDIIAENLILDNTRLVATTQSQQNSNQSQGDIDINVDRLILLKNNSKISTEGFNQATGGNITINTPENQAKLLVGLPSKGDGNDITANASEAAGGDITINAQSVAGFTRSQPRENDNTNNINASSRTNVEGTININSVDVDPNDNKPPLPESFNPPLVKSTCNPGGQNSFVSVAQGGRRPEFERVPIQLWDDSRSITPNDQFLTPSEQIHSTPQPAPISEAQGWTRNTDGNIQLITTHGSPAIASNASSCKTAQNP